MTLRHPLILAATIPFVGFAAVAAFQAFGPLGVILLVVTAIFLVLAILFTYRFRSELIDEMEVGVIFNRVNNSFCRFAISPEPNPGANCRNYRLSRWLPFGLEWLKLNDPYFVRLRWYEELTDKIPKRAQSATGTLVNLRTIEGVPITLEWKVSYTIDVTLIPEKLQHKMARALPRHSDKMVTSKVVRAVKHLVETRTIQSLYELKAIQELEQELCQRVNRQLSHPVNLGFREIQAKDVYLGPITMPTQVEKALELAHQRKIQAETVAGALERLKRAVDGFSKEDIRRWSELERLRILDDKDAGMLYLSDAFVRSESVKVKKNVNGRS